MHDVYVILTTIIFVIVILMLIYLFIKFLKGQKDMSMKFTKDKYLLTTKWSYSISVLSFFYAFVNFILSIKIINAELRINGYTDFLNTMIIIFSFISLHTVIFGTYTYLKYIDLSNE